ncbi:MAG: flagellar M-ring protein FliF [Spirochaetaceae bacterium]|jgi:flagellar M-ring protein FliF|nr:flagellar M-ring protein FliF [Spirochaetaceae bacterium]
MGNFFKRLTDQVKGLWGKWTRTQKIIGIGIAVVAIALIVGLVAFSGSPSMVPVIDTPIRNEADLDRIVARINEEGVRVSTSQTGIVMVQNQEIARRMRAILVSEGLVPQGTDPWAVFDVSSWTITDFERNIQLQRAITKTVTEHIKAVAGVDNANVIITVPDQNALFVSDRQPITASVIITPRPGSDITTNRQNIEGIQKLLMLAVSGLTAENIVITDQNGVQINDFDGMSAIDRVTLTEKQQKVIQKLENDYRAKILASLQQTFSADRVRDLNIKFDMDWSPQTVNKTEYSGITVVPDNPATNYDDSQVVDSLKLSEQVNKTSWKGTGMNPEGPAGTEGQVAPQYKDMSNLAGEMTQDNSTTNYALNSATTTSNKEPAIDRVSVSVNIDGTWAVNFDADGKQIKKPDGTLERIYTPISAADLTNAQRLIQSAIGYNQSRGDTVTVTNIQIDRTAQFAAQDQRVVRGEEIRQAILLFLIGLVGLMLIFIAIRIIGREIERRKRVREEELARQQEALRQNAILEAENQGMEVSMSVEERRRMELQENAMNMAKEHTPDVAQLIRTWLAEE